MAKEFRLSHTFMEQTLGGVTTDHLDCFDELRAGSTVREREQRRTIMHHTRSARPRALCANEMMAHELNNISFLAGAFALIAWSILAL
jgi:hypothetical protein